LLSKNSDATTVKIMKELARGSIILKNIMW